MATVEHCLYCFETLSSTLEKRPSMTLYQVQASWADYPKGLDDTEDDLSDAESPSDSEPSPMPTKTSRPKIPAVKRLGSSRSPASSSSSLSHNTAETTPNASETSFTPPGIHPRRTSQRSANLTSSPLFVTWSQGPLLHLRGCIGTFESLPLASGLSSYSITSALHDTRFSPIAASELPSLTVSVTLLTDFEDAKDPLDWELGVHGIKISFYARNKRYGACYLPDVAVEQGWDKEETIVSLMRKAGWGGTAKGGRWREVGDFRVERFQGVRENVGYEEYRSWKEWVERGKKDSN